MDEDSKWRSVASFDDVPSGSFINWTYSVDMRGLSKGNHTLYARAVGADGGYSLIYSKEFTVIDPPPLEVSPWESGAGIFAVIILLIVVAIAVWMYKKKRRR
jgi:hypothetical protein